MKFTQIISLTLAALVVNGAGIPTQNNYDGSTLGAVDHLANFDAMENIDTTEPEIRTIGFLARFGRKKPTSEEAGDITQASEQDTRENVVVVMKNIIGDVLDAFNEFGAAAGIDLNNLLEDTGYELEVSIEKRNKRADLEKRTGIGLVVGLIPVALKMLKAVLGGVSNLTGAVCGTCQSRPELAFAANAAGAISAVL